MMSLVDQTVVSKKPLQMELFLPVIYFDWQL
jgi:hypothetical protein